MLTKEHVPLILRVGLSLVFLWFGLNQLFDTTNFLGYLPEFLLQQTYAESFVRLNGGFETILGILLLIGRYIKPVTIILALHLIGIIISLGYGDIAIRDVGLLFMTIAIYMGGKDKWSLDYKRSSH